MTRSRYHRYLYCYIHTTRSCKMSCSRNSNDSDAALRYECRLLIGSAVRSSMRHAAPASLRKFPIQIQRRFESPHFDIWSRLPCVSYSLACMIHIIHIIHGSFSFCEHWLPLIQFNTL